MSVLSITTFMLSFLVYTLFFLAPCRESKLFFYCCFWPFDAKLFRARKLKAEISKGLGDNTGEIFEEHCIPPPLYLDARTHTHTYTEGEREKEKRKLFLMRERRF
ncbi:uncharacterized protein TrAFT101_003465 [Trichoderma asperellum]|uniref:uncharacterized protein n=1 Tax=Trichoderma asperellum TaxID=101201 RepID=UPI00331EC3AE|nr:hypothetical protein TrAFT101_003465 [Trichoderma asperellum]